MTPAEAFLLLGRHLAVGLEVWQADDGDLRLVTANAAAGRFAGVDLCASTGATMRAIFPQMRAELHAYYLELASVAPAGSVAAAAVPVSQPLTGQSTHAEAMPLPGHCIGITTHALTEEARIIAEREQRFRTLLEHSTDAIVVCDAQARILYASQAMGRIMGYAHGDLVGALGWPMVHPDDEDLARSEFARVLASPGVPVKNQIRIRHRDGSWRLIEVVTVNRLDDPMVQATVSNFRDITEQRKTEQALRRTEEQLQHAVKMEAVGRLAGGVAHDFNNLLSIVLSYSDMLLLEPKAEAVLEEIGEIKRAGERAAELTRQLLVFSCKQVLEPRTIDVSHTVAETRRLVDRMVGESVEVRFVQSEDLWLTRLDPHQLVQVLLNLVANARDAMPGGGILTIETANLVTDEAFARLHLNVAPGPYVTLTVTDTGTGMDQETRVRIFEPFFTTKALGKGTGLGLSMVHGIVEQSGGSIWVYSEPGTGTTFRLLFPRAPAEGATDDASAGVVVEPEVRGGSETILVVDDDADVAAVARSILLKHGYTVVMASSGQEALRQASAVSTFDLLVTDVAMPDMNGPTLARRLREAHPGLRVLFLSGYADSSLVHEALLEPGSRYLQKPLTMRTFASRVRVLLDEGAP
jgi:two-component system, cell cycle sensor histidine kinase and response regulator CckA